MDMSSLLIQYGSADMQALLSNQLGRLFYFVVVGFWLEFKNSPYDLNLKRTL